MKFNWGTGILIFIILFLLACAAFIIFAFQQDVNLVHKDYYEKGVDFTEQMNINTRSEKFAEAIKIVEKAQYLQIGFDASLAAQIDSGRVLFYRPSNSKQDISLPLNLEGNSFNFPKENVVNGRYIVKIFWFAGGIKYEVDKPVNIQ